MYTFRSPQDARKSIKVAVVEEIRIVINIDRNFNIDINSTFFNTGM